MLILQFGNETLGPASKLTIIREGMAPTAVEVWRVEISADAATPAGIEQRLQALREVLGSTRDLSLLHDDGEVRALKIGDCRHGPTLKSLKEVDAAPGEAHNRRQAALEFRATLQDANSVVQAHEFTLQATHAAGKPAGLLTRGRIVLRAGEEPADHEGLLPAVATGYRRVRQVSTRDASEPAIEYETQDEQIFSRLPGGVEDGHYVISESLSSDGRPVRTLSGFFVGVSARARALELRASDDRLISARIDENPFSRRVDFQFSELSGSTETLAGMESLTFTTTRRVVDHPLLDHALPAYRQQIGVPQTEVIQEGSAVGVGRHPNPPQPRYAADLLERRVQYSIPHPDLPAERRWVTSWRYVSRGRTTIRGEV